MCRDEQYKLLWNELEEFFRSSVDTSANHQNVLDCFLECTGRGDTKSSSFSKQKGSDDKRLVTTGDRLKVMAYDMILIISRIIQRYLELSKDI